MLLIRIPSLVCFHLWIFSNAWNIIHKSCSRIQSTDISVIQLGIPACFLLDIILPYFHIFQTATSSVVFVFQYMYSKLLNTCIDRWKQNICKGSNKEQSFKSKVCSLLVPLQNILLHMSSVDDNTPFSSCRPYFVFFWVVYVTDNNDYMSPPSHRLQHIRRATFQENLFCRRAVHQRCYSPECTFWTFLLLYLTINSSEDFYYLGDLIYSQ